MEKVFITGAGGFIGKPTIEAALKNPDWEVHALLSRRHASNFPPEMHIHTADLADPCACEYVMRQAAPDILIHLAWATTEDDYADAVSNLMWIENSLRLLRMFFRHGGRRFVFCGSSTEYGRPARQNAENLTAIQRSVYGESKLAFENVCRTYCAKANHEFVSARCFTVYGENDARIFPAIPAAIQAFGKGERFTCKSPRNVWDFIYVDDAAEALVKIAASNYCGVVNVGSGRPHLLENVFTEIAEKMRCPELLSFEAHNSDVSMLVADTTILNETIGYTCRTDISDGLDRTIAWWKAQNFRPKRRQ